MEKFEEALTILIDRKTKKYKTGVGTVKQVTGDTCVLERENLPELPDVRLNSISGDFEDVMIVYPSVGSEVLYLQVENAPEENCIAKYSKIDKVKITIGGASFEMSAGKFEFKNNDANLKEILSETFDRLNSAIITTPNGPGQFSPLDKEFFLQEKIITENLFK